MTKSHFHRLFDRVYFVSAGLCILFYIWSEYFLYRSNDCETGPFAAPRHWQSFSDDCVVFLFVLPVLITAVVMTLVRLTNRVEPLTEEQRGVSFVERLSKVQLFLPLSLLLLVPVVLQIHLSDRYTTAGRLYLFILIHAAAVWLLVLWLRRIARIRKTGWKILSIVGFILAGIVYEFAFGAGMYRCSKTGTDEVYRVACEISNGGEAVEADAGGFSQMPPEELASDMMRKTLATYDYYEGDPWILINTASDVLQYDPTRTCFDAVFSTREMTREEIERQRERQRLNFERIQELGRYFKWLRDDTSSDELETLGALMKKYLLSLPERYDYAAFAKRVDMLDLAYRDLQEQAACDEDDWGYYFGEVYRYASETPLQWENYGSVISNPYIRSTVEDSEEDQELLLWAYTFWGRRYNDGNYWICRALLDKVLEAHPNTLYPRERIEKQNALMRDAEARVGKFLQWYKANYWSFRELKAAQYDDADSLVKIDRGEYAKYLHALKASGYLSPKLLRRLEITDSGAGDSLRMGRVRERHGEWLRTDPLLGNYDAIAGDIDSLTCRTELIRKPGQAMRITTSIENLQAEVQRIDGKWFICDILSKNK